MSYLDCPEAQCEPGQPQGPVELVLVPRSSDIGGFEVHRVLPSRQRRLVGPFIFFDQMGPAHLGPGNGIDVRPHPHIGLATVTYLFDGELMHRDSLGTRMRIRPGAVNWMTAGSGIVHSERSPDDIRGRGGELSGTQAWVALPRSEEETAPDFSHHAKGDLPLIEDDGLLARVLAGQWHGLSSPVPTRSETLYVDVRLGAGKRIGIPASVEERAIHLASGRIKIDGQEHAPGRMLVLAPGAEPVVEALDDARWQLLGGEPIDGPRYIWWNFVSSSRERIEQAKADWDAERFDRVPEESERIPLPDLPGP